MAYSKNRKRSQTNKSRNRNNSFNSKDEQKIKTKDTKKM